MGARPLEDQSLPHRGWMEVLKIERCSKIISFQMCRLIILCVSVTRKLEKIPAVYKFFEMILLMAKSNLMQEISSSIYLFFLDIIEIEKFGKSGKDLRISGIPLGRRGMIGPAGPAMRLGRTEGGPR